MTSVAIVNYNTCEHLRACLMTIEPEMVSRVVVVDNASSDGSVSMVQAEYPWVKIYANRKNLGYGAAANQAIAGCEGPHVLLLNSDTRLQPGTLCVLNDYLDRHPGAAIVGPRLLNPNGTLQPSCYPLPTPLHVFLQESTLARLISGIPILRDRYARTWNHAQDRLVPWVLGAALAIRRQAFDAVGGFDTSFFVYAEEIDLCYRLRKAGWQTHFTPRTNIIHYGGASTRQQREEMTAQFFFSMVHFYRQHYSKSRLIQLFIVMKSIVLARLLRDSIRLRLAREKREHARLAEQIAAWRRILVHRSR